MSVWSRMWGSGTAAAGMRTIFTTAARRSGDHGPPTMKIVPSRFQWEKFKDLLHFYTMVGLIPLSIGLFCVNVFIGPAQLEPIPEGYEPKYWEYHRHPITRFIARYLQHSPQQDYEKFAHFLYEESEKCEMRKLQNKIKDKMFERQDYQGYYYRPVMAKYYRIYKEFNDERMENQGDK